MRLLILFLFIPFFGFSQGDTVSADTTIYDYVEVEPQFPGGESEMIQFIFENMNYPEKAAEQGLQGSFYFEFIVEIDGSLTHGRCLNCETSELDQMIIDLINKMPKWTPAKKGGEYVRMRYTLPLMINIK
ncbi:MAG: protein TonB [Arenicella sp.]|jgi:protein TonB